MRTLLSLAALAAVAGCGGGGGGTAPSLPAPTQAPLTPSGYITPQFVIVVPPSGASTSSARKPRFVSTATKSVTITLTSVNGSSSGLPSPSSVTTNINGSACASGCTVNGPASPPGTDAYSVTTYDGTGGSAGNNALDTGSATATLAPGANATVSIVLNGIPSSVAIANVPTGWHANTSNAQALTVNVMDHSGQTITGTYASTVRITDPDTQSTNGTNVTGTHAGTGCTTTCVDLTGSGDVVTLNYGGLAENPVTLASSGTGLATAGTGTFTPILNPIVSEPTNPVSQAAGHPVGIDLFTPDSSATVGYTGSVKYYEDGFTNAPYSNALSTTVPAACSAFANVQRAALGVVNGSHTDTIFTATSVAAPAAGSCTLTVTDGLTDQANALPQFVVTYTTGFVNANAKRRANR